MELNMIRRLMPVVSTSLKHNLTGTILLIMTNFIEPGANFYGVLTVRDPFNNGPEHDIQVSLLEFLSFRNRWECEFGDRPWWVHVCWEEKMEEYILYDFYKHKTEEYSFSQMKESYDRYQESGWWC